MAGHYQNKTDLDSWIEESVKSYRGSNFSTDIHIDSFSDLSGLSTESIVIKSLELAKRAFSLFKGMNAEELVLYLSIELNESENESKVPMNFKSLLAEVDKFSIPEIIIYKPSIEVGSVELHRVPLLFPEFSGLLALHKKVRQQDEMINNSDFTCELIILSS